MVSVNNNGGRRFIIGIGVSSYNDATLNLSAVSDDVAKVTSWFAEQSSVAHERALPELAGSPSYAGIQQELSKWLKQRQFDDVVVIYLAAHGEQEGGIAYVLGKDSPRKGLAGQAISGETLGSIIGQSPPHNVLLIVDACVAGRLGTAIQRRAEDVADELNTRDPHHKWSQAVLCSTFSRDPAHDGRFVQAFLKVVSEERWTGSSRSFIDFDLLMTGLNQELKDLRVPQVAERKVWGPGAADLIPNPNYRRRQLSTLIVDEELASHFDPSSRGVIQGESGWYFSGRDQELSRIARWLNEPAGSLTSHLLVITGSPGSGKSALISRVIVLSDPRLREQIPQQKNLSKHVLPSESSITAALWCRNKTLDEVVVDLGTRLGLNGHSPSALVDAINTIATRESNLSIAVDALDEAVEGSAAHIASELIVPLAALENVKVLVATRPQPIYSADGPDDVKSLLDELRVTLTSENCILLDNAENRVEDMRKYVLARLMASTEAGRVTPYTHNADVASRLAERIVAAAGNSFLVAAVTARSFAGRAEAVDPATETLELPKEAGAALMSYINRLSEPHMVVDILRPIAWAEGAGLPWGSLWAPIANALARAVNPDVQVQYDDKSIAAVLDRASDLVVEAMESGEPVYRLFHAKLGESLRIDLSPRIAHAAIAASLDAVLKSAPYEAAPGYTLAHFASHLFHTPEQYRRLFELATSPDWERAKRERFGHPAGFLRDVDLAMQGALRAPQDFASLTGACLVYARQMAVAPAPVIDVIARAGQLQRAELMANNITFALERCWAYSLLAPTLQAEGDLSGATRCLNEAERSIAALDVTDSAMAWSWVSSASMSCGFRERAVRASRSAAKSLETLTTENDWQAPNLFFWAGLAARIAEDSETRSQLRDVFAVKFNSRPYSNQLLQAAAVLAATDWLRGVWKEWMGPDRDFIYMLRDGNLALALADSGMMKELNALFAIIEADRVARPSSDDTTKHFAWALAIAGRFDWALRQIEYIDDAEQRLRAVDRIVDVAASQGEQDILATARSLVKDVEGVADLRVRTLVVRILYKCGEQENALLLAEELVRERVEPTEQTCVAFPKPDTGQPSTHRLRIHTVITELDDEKIAKQTIALARQGKHDEAVAKLADIIVPRFRWEARFAIATEAPPEVDSLTLWRDALLEARHVNEVAVRLSAFGLAALLRQRSAGVEDVESLKRDVKNITKRWSEAGFAEQYESLREFLRSGNERTQRMADLFNTIVRDLSLGDKRRDAKRTIRKFRLDLLSSERRSKRMAHYLWRLLTSRDSRSSAPDLELLWGFSRAQASLWTAREARELAESGSAGKRLFALALMESRPKLASFDSVSMLIRSSLSAFEQYHGLEVMLQIVPELSRNERTKLCTLLEQERRRYISIGTDRYSLTVEIERAMNKRQHKYKSV